jgi:4-oxalocrotonate tautomerase
VSPHPAAWYNGGLEENDVPLIQVNLAAGRTDEQKRALLSAITDAVHTSIGAPLDSIRVWIAEFEATEYMQAGELLADRRRSTGG